MTTTTTRRAALAAEPAEPLVELYAQWRQALVAAEAADAAAEACCSPVTRELLIGVDRAEYEALEARCDAAGKHAYDLLVQLSETPTRTLAGARIKARLAADLVGEDELVGEKLLFDLEDTGSALIRTLADALEALPA